MFTGLIEAVGTVSELTPTPAGCRMRVDTTLAPQLGAGDSLAVSGVCLTVVGRGDSWVEADVSPETLRISSLARVKVGSLLNLERPLRADARLGGHFVQGHVDATGTIEVFRAQGEAHWLTIGFPPALGPYLVRKGSVAVDGISLTVATVSERQFAVQIIPFTREQTNLRAARAGDIVNIECDILGKYVIRALELGQRRT